MRALRRKRDCRKTIRRGLSTLAPILAVAHQDMIALSKAYDGLSLEWSKQLRSPTAFSWVRPEWKGYAASSFLRRTNRLISAHVTNKVRVLVQSPVAHFHESELWLRHLKHVLLLCLIKISRFRSRQLCLSKLRGSATKSIPARILWLVGLIRIDLHGERSFSNSGCEHTPWQPRANQARPDCIGTMPRNRNDGADRRCGARIESCRLLQNESRLDAPPGCLLPAPDASGPSGKTDDFFTD